MTLEEFTEEFDKDSAVILFGGKRRVLPKDVELLSELGRLLTTKTDDYENREDEI